MTQAWNAEHRIAAIPQSTYRTTDARIKQQHFKNNIEHREFSIL
jgi:hypothetical protein